MQSLHGTDAVTRSIADGSGRRYQPRRAQYTANANILIVQLERDSVSPIGDEVWRKRRLPGHELRVDFRICSFSEYDRRLSEPFPNASHAGTRAPGAAPAGCYGGSRVLAARFPSGCCRPLAAAERLEGRAGSRGFRACKQDARNRIIARISRVLFTLLVFELIRLREPFKNASHAGTFPLARGASRLLRRLARSRKARFPPGCRPPAAAEQPEGRRRLSRIPCMVTGCAQSDHHELRKDFCIARFLIEHQITRTLY
jgi:hypothetical protein